MDPATTLPWIVVHAFVAACTIFSNLLMTTVFITSRAVRRMRTALFLMGMTAADLIVGVAVIPMYIAILWLGGRLGDELRYSYMSIETLSSSASLILLVVITLERVYSVFRPYRHRALSKTPYWVGLFISWFLAALQVIFRLLPGFSDVISRKHSAPLAIAFFVVVPIAIVVSYLTIWWKLRNIRVVGLQRSRGLKERRMVKAMAILTGVFLTTWLPYSIINILYYFHMEVHPILRGLSPEASRHIICTCKVLHYSNSFMNPLIYSFRIREVRRALDQIFRGDRGDVVALAGLQRGLRRREVILEERAERQEEGAEWQEGRAERKEEGAQWQEEVAEWQEKMAEWQEGRAERQEEGAEWQEGRAERKEEGVQWQEEGAEWQEKMAELVRRRGSLTRGKLEGEQGGEGVNTGKVEELEGSFI